MAPPVFKTELRVVTLRGWFDSIPSPPISTSGCVAICLSVARCPATTIRRSACYMARYIAKNIVAAGLAQKCEVQLAYAIGVADPVSVLVDTKDTEKVAVENLDKLVRKHFPLTPRGIIDYLKLRRPIFRKTASYGHFGRNEPEFTWEKTNKAKILRKDAGL